VKELIDKKLLLGKISIKKSRLCVKSKTHAISFHFLNIRQKSLRNINLLSGHFDTLPSNESRKISIITSCVCFEIDTQLTIFYISIVTDQAFLF